jgi:hypothetical protein
MRSRRVQFVLFILFAGLAVLTATFCVNATTLPVNPYVVLGLLICVTSAGLVYSVLRATKERRLGDRTTTSSDDPRPAIAPPDGHIRFTLVVEDLDAKRVEEMWSDLCRPDRPATEELRLLFRNFTIMEGRRFRFLRGDPTATAALLRSVLGSAAGVEVRTSLEPAAERTPPWS